MYNSRDSGRAGACRSRESRETTAANRRTLTCAANARSAPVSRLTLLAGKGASGSIADLPFGRGRKYGANSSLAEWLGDWTLSGAISIQNGFPMSFSQSDNTGLLGGVQRPSITPGVNLNGRPTPDDPRSCPTCWWEAYRARTGAFVPRS